MITFHKKQIKPNKRVCLRLKELREERGLSLTELAKKSRLSEKHLRALEDCQFDSLPEGIVYKKNFLKLYLKALGVNPVPFMKQFADEELSGIKTNEDSRHPKKHIRTAHFGNLPGIVRFAVVSLIVISFILYLGVQVQNMLKPPELTLFSPENGYISNQSSISVQGQTEKEVRISINGKEVANDETGQFDKSVDLQPGLNTIIVTAEKKHGKSTSETRHVVLKDETRQP